MLIDYEKKNLFLLVIRAFVDLRMVYACDWLVMFDSDAPGGAVVIFSWNTRSIRMLLRSIQGAGQDAFVSTTLYRHFNNFCVETNIKT